MMLYFIQSENEGLVRIGLADDVQAKLSALQAECPVKLTLLAVTQGGGKTIVQLRERFKKEHRYGQWFTPSPRLRNFIDNIKTSLQRENFEDSMFIDRHKLARFLEECTFRFP